ncbi:threonine/serine exporter family protein [Janibacter sp. YIM B02568]|uniref:threonine/serine ThrE exporter family protein n=1 Tax=Janibacter endophyticus TaxID=2806261 RepID=UPI001950A529|nr:threonine/serine exporter family protein [Janibacter endophyticus]MBM6545290.1 threonine/serine exporter family protein [Janibacter endophyticus]
MSERPRRRPSVRGEAPTETLPMLGTLRGTPYRDPRVTRAVAEEHAVAEVIDVCLRVGELMLRSGAGAPSVEAATTAVAVAGGLEDMDVDLTMQSLHIQARTPSGSTVSRLRVVRAPQMDFARLAAVHSLVDDLVSGEVSIDQARGRLQEIRRAPRMWAKWIVTLGQGGVAAGVAMVLGAGWVGVLVALLTAVVVDRVLRALAAINLPDFYTGAIGGAVATTVAFIAYVLGRMDWFPMSPADFAYVVAGGIVMLLPSRTITSAMEDIIGGYPVTGTARLVAVLLHSFGLIVGVATALTACLAAVDAAGIILMPPDVGRLAWATSSPQMVFIGSAVVGLAGAVTLQAGRRMLLPAAALGVVAVALASYLTQVGMGRVTSTGIAAVALGFGARLVALRMDSPPITLGIPASFGLMPGLSIFIGLFHLTVPDGAGWQGSPTQGWASVLTALGVILAIATGVTLGEVLAAPLDSPVNQRRRLSGYREQRDEALGDRAVIEQPRSREGLTPEVTES